MKAVLIQRFGPPAESIDVAELPEPPAPGPREVLVDIEACPINPADLLLIEGRYAVKPPLPAPIGAEGVGIVRAAGAEVRHLRAGDRVLLLGARGNWRQRATLAADLLFPLPSGVDPLQLAMLTVNPATAWVMLTGFVTLQPGDWVIQNAANSAVGTSVMRLARTLGVKTVNVVRRRGAEGAVRAAGGDAAVMGGPGLAKRVAKATGGAPVRLGLDAVGGSATQRLANSLAEGGLVVNYGLLSGRPCMIDAADAVFRDVGLKGFWLRRWIGNTPANQVRDMYLKLAALIADGTLAMPVEAVYPLARVREAVAHAGRAGRSGKVLLRPNADS